MNITISVDDQTLSRARAVARRQGISLQGLLRRYLQSLTGRRSEEQVADELLALMETSGGRSRGRRLRRGTAYEGRA